MFSICQTRNTTSPCTQRRKRLSPTIPVPSRYRNRPTSVRRAIHIVWKKTEELGLTRSDVSVFQAIIASGVSTEHPERPIFARKTTLARLAEVTERTVYRTLKKLEEKNLIVRNEQTRLQDGSMEIAQIFLTEKSIALLLLIDNNNTEQNKINKNIRSVQEPKNESPLHSFNKATHLSDGLSDGSVYKEQRSEQDTSVYNQSPVPKQSSQNANYVRVDGRSVARELFWLIEEKRLTYSGLFLLQKMAKNIGQRLSDFVQLRSSRLRELPSANDCFRYLRSLITQGVDAKFLCTLKNSKVHTSHRNQQMEIVRTQRSNAFLEIDGKRYRDEELGRVYQICAPSETLLIFAEDGFRSLGTVRLTSKHLHYISKGRWKPMRPKNLPEKGQLPSISSLTRSVICVLQGGQGGSASCCS